MEKGKLLTVKALAELLGMSQQAIRARVYRNQLPAYKLGGTLVFRWDEVENALKPLEKEGRGKGGRKNEREVQNG